MLRLAFPPERSGNWRAASFGAHHWSLGSGRRVVKDRGRVPCVDAARGTLSHGPVYGATKTQEQCSSSARRESSRSPAHAHENAENGRTRRSPLFPGGSTGRLFPHAKRQYVYSCRSWDRWALGFNSSMDLRRTFGSALSGSRNALSAKDVLLLTTARQCLRSHVHADSWLPTPGTHYTLFRQGVTELGEGLPDRVRRATNREYYIIVILRSARSPPDFVPNTPAQTRPNPIRRAISRPQTMAPARAWWLHGYP